MDLGFSVFFLVCCLLLFIGLVVAFILLIKDKDGNAVEVGLFAIGLILPTILLCLVVHDASQPTKEESICLIEDYDTQDWVFNVLEEKDYIKVRVKASHEEKKFSRSSTRFVYLDNLEESPLDKSKIELYTIPMVIETHKYGSRYSYYYVLVPSDFKLIYVY